LLSIGNLHLSGLFLLKSSVESLNPGITFFRNTDAGRSRLVSCTRYFPKSRLDATF